jgi:hypothetical protein
MEFEYKYSLHKINQEKTDKANAVQNRHTSGKSNHDYG